MFRCQYYFHHSSRSHSIIHRCRGQHHRVSAILCSGVSITFITPLDLIAYMYMDKLGANQPKTVLSAVAYSLVHIPNGYVHVYMYMYMCIHTCVYIHYTVYMYMYTV